MARKAPSEASAARKAFQPVERLPVPPEVDESFKALRSAEISKARTPGRFSGRPGKFVEGAAERAATKIRGAEFTAAQHFGGDADKMRTHFKRWARWGGKAMELGDNPFLPVESINEGMKKVERIYNPARIKRTRGEGA